MFEARRDPIESSSKPADTEITTTQQDQPQNTQQERYQRSEEPRDYFREREFRPDNRRYGRRERDPNMMRMPHLRSAEREQLRRLVDQYKFDWNRIGDELRKDPRECQDQWEMWESQPDWNSADESKLLDLDSRGVRPSDMVKEFEGRSEIGIKAKLQVLRKRNSRDSYNRDRDDDYRRDDRFQRNERPRTERGTVADDIVNKALYLVRCAKSMQLDECKKILAEIERFIDSVKPSEEKPKETEA